ncbi:hypothetical protein CALCODRAFT_118883 [Calocera cornea HHB12733]|uniref:Uncharacterized protein n=1 Tax=Calocera cornea HHB12733 TaxID=1353952 RepID=A0A165IDS2_9BASI|nr:hypothetical protein CALCODRAFT_118883 [Calocera cornea HHB12733]
MGWSEGAGARMVRAQTRGASGRGARQSCNALSHAHPRAVSRPPCLLLPSATPLLALFSPPRPPSACSPFSLGLPCTGPFQLLPPLPHPHPLFQHHTRTIIHAPAGPGLPAPRKDRT